MDSVRFSIIENDLRWEDNSEERIEISSESSGGGVPSNTQQPPTTPKYTHEIWKRDEIENSLKNLPGTDYIIEIVDSENLIEINNSPRDINTALLWATVLGKPSCVSQLLDIYHADPNTTDDKGRTPLHLSCSIPDPVITKILLRHGASAHQWDISRKITPLHCAASAGSLECINLLLRNGAQVNAGIEKRSALHYAIESNAIQCVNVLLNFGASPNTPQVYTETPLHVASTLGYKECIKLLLAFGGDVRSQFGRRKLTALHLAVEEDHTDCVRALLDANADIDARNVDMQTPLHLACLSQSAETVDLLIARGANVNAIYKDGRTALHAAIVKESKDWECAKLLLMSSVDVNKADNFGYTPLHMAALNEYGPCANLLIEYGADITARTSGGVTALTFIVRRTPEVVPKYISKFDSSIKVNDSEIGDVDCEIKLDFKFLVPNTERGETELLLAFIDVGQKRVLKHPLCETFLFLKWRRIRKFFLFSLFFHAIFVLLFTLFVLGVYVKDCPHGKNTVVPLCAKPYYINYIAYVVISLNFIMLSKEIFQMAHGFISYVRYWENWLQWTIILSVFMCMIPDPLLATYITEIPEWQNHVAGVVIFLVWLELMMLVGRFPIFGLYVQMFTKVAVNFSKFLLTYSCLIIAFGLSFGVLFSNYKAFKTVPWALLKTVVMMAGELEFEDIFYGEDEVENPVTSQAIFLTFVILVTVILTNLLVGLAVSDIQGLQDSAGLDRLSRQAELVSRLEGLFYSKLLQKLPKRLIELCQQSALLRTSRCRLQFCVKPNDPRDKRLPKDLIVSIYKLVAERRDRNQSIRRKKKNSNYSFFKRTISHQDSDPVQLRKFSSSNLRLRTLSENPNGFHSLHSRMSRDDRISEEPSRMSNANELMEMLQKMEKNQEAFMKKLQDINSEVLMLKMKINN